ncbi:MAG TPA: hypothetical protein VJT31_34680 [Rugosimonospora sp.]|nr:hypothetical protein [Rugosimonospora sp.]
MTGFIDARQPQALIPDSGYNPRHALFESPRSNPLEWARRRRSDRESRRAEVARGRAVTKLTRLGEAWKVLDIQEIGLLNPNTFLAIGPGGVFVVIVKQQGRSRVRLAGDVVQIDGKRPQYVAEARRAADEAGKALSRTAGSTIPVTPIIAFAGTGGIDVHGLPKGCLITSYRELDHLLSSYGERIGPRTVQKLYSIAKHPVTWVNPQQEAQIEAYTWYTSQSLPDKKAVRR